MTTAQSEIEHVNPTRRRKEHEMTNGDPASLPVPAFAGGTKAITTTPVVGTPQREHAEMFVPGESG
jgi:hypothetical protein